MMKILAALLLFGITSGCAVRAQNISMYQLTNYAVAMRNGRATNATAYSNFYFGGTSLFMQFGTGFTGDFLLFRDSPTNVFIYKDNNSTRFGDAANNIPTLISGQYVLIDRPMYDSTFHEFVTTLQASNNVQVAAGAGISVAGSGAGGVQTWTITDLSGLGATNAISTFNTNNVLVGAGLTAITSTNGTDINTFAFSNNSAVVFGFNLNPTVRSDATNYTDTRAVNLSNYTALAVGTVGTNATNYANSIGAGATNAINALGSALTNAVKAEGALSTNFTVATATSLTNKIDAGNVALTNLANSKQNGSVVLSSLSSSGIGFQGNMISNVSQILYQLQTTPVPTNSSQSNVVVNLRTNKYFLTITNNITLTNFTGIQAGIGGDTTLIVLPQLVNRGVAYPTLGGSSFGIRVYTNANSPMWTTLTQGIAYAISVSAFGTNTFWAITEWK